MVDGAASRVSRFHDLLIQTGENVGQVKGVKILEPGIDFSDFLFHDVVVLVSFSITKIQQFFETTKFFYTFLQKKIDVFYTFPNKKSPL